MKKARRTTLYILGSACDHPGAMAARRALSKNGRPCLKFPSYRCAAIAAAVVALSGCGYNSLQAEDENAAKAWSNLDATYRRRADLIPNLVNVVKGYAQHESSLLEKVTELRSHVGSVTLSPADLDDPAALQRYQGVQKELSGAFSRLLAVTESYPALKANENFRDLMAQLEGTENRISVAIQDYNAAVSALNTHLRQFPASFTNSLLLHLKPKPYFAATTEDKKRPDVVF